MILPGILDINWDCSHKILTQTVKQLSVIIIPYLKSHFISRCILFQSQVASEGRAIARAPTQIRLE